MKACAFIGFRDSDQTWGVTQLGGGTLRGSGRDRGGVKGGKEKCTSIYPPKPPNTQEVIAKMDKIKKIKIYFPIFHPEAISNPPT